MNKLTKAERRILENQYRILGAIEGNEDAYKIEIEILSHGYERLYEEYILDNSDGISEADCKFVEEIMWIYYLLKLAKNKDKLPISGGRGDMTKWEPIFPGFDGNNDSDKMAYARFITHEIGQYEEHKHYLNSHGSNPHYAAMILEWKSMGTPADLTVEQADRIIAAG